MQEACSLTLQSRDWRTVPNCPTLESQATVVLLHCRLHTAFGINAKRARSAELPHCLPLFVHSQIQRHSLVAASQAVFSGAQGENDLLIFGRDLLKRFY